MLERMKIELSVNRWKVFLVIAGVIALGASSALLWIHSQNYMAGYVERLLEARLGMKARVEALGTSRRGIVLKQVALEKNGKVIRIDTVVVDIDLARLVSGEVVPELTLRGVDVALNHATESAPVCSSTPTSTSSGATTQASLVDAPETSSLHFPVAMRLDAVSALAKVFRESLPPETRVRVLDLRLFKPGGGASTPLVEVTEAELALRDSGLVLEAHTVYGPGEQIEWAVRLDPVKPPSGSITLDAVRLSSLTNVLPQTPWYRPEDSRLDGTLELGVTADGKLVLEGDVAVERIGVDAPFLSHDPVVVDLTVAGRATWDGESLRVVSSRIRAGASTSQITGNVRFVDDSYQLDVDLIMPSQSCNDAMSAIPPSLMGRYEGFEWEGSFGGELQIVLDTNAPEATRLRFDLQNECRFVGAPATADLTRFQRKFEHRVRGEDGVIFSFETGPGSNRWTSLSQTSPFLIHAVLAHEDATFLRHGGFATFAIETALERNLEQGRFAYGASTISMQLAKNLFLERDKSLTRKLREVFLTWWLESKMTKAQILELYLNVIEFGPKIYGIQSAAQHYFGRRPWELSGAESAFLATVLPSPVSYADQYERGAPSEATKRKMAVLLRHMHARGRIDDDALYFGLIEVDRMWFHHGDRRPSARIYQGFTAPLPIPTASTASLDRWDWRRMGRR